MFHLNELKFQSLTHATSFLHTESAVQSEPSIASGWGRICSLLRMRRVLELGPGFLRHLLCVCNTFSKDMFIKVTLRSPRTY